MIDPAQLPHLRLVRAELQGQRRPGRGAPPRRIHASRTQHGQALNDRSQELAALHAQRHAVFGIDPKLVFVLELAGNVSASALRAAGLTVLDGQQAQAVVAFSDDPQLNAFLERIRAYQAAGDAAATAPNDAFIDAIGNVRPYGPADRLTRRIVEQTDGLGSADVLDLQLDLWHPGDAGRAAEWLAETRTAIENAGGALLDSYISDAAGLLLARAHLPNGALSDLARLDPIALIDGIPRPAGAHLRPRSATPDDLPSVTPPQAEAPLVGLVDSGVRSAHPLLEGTIYDATTLSADFLDGQDEHGHGTRIAGLLVHGPLGDVLERDFLPRPSFRVLSVRVLDADNLFPDATVWESEVERAIRHCAEQGARVINLSVGDPDTPYRGGRSTPLAAIIDQLVRELGIVVVVPTGNVAPAVYSPLGDDFAAAFVRELVESPHTGMLDPAPAVAALTVGALAPNALAGMTSPTGSATRRALGERGWPAPFTRTGPGIDRAIKPELSANGGSLAWDSELRAVVDDQGLEIVSTAAAADRLLDSEIGTSYAAPLVSRVAGTIHARYPDFGSNLLRALTLVGAQHTASDAPLVHLPAGELRTAQLRLGGYGEPDLARSVESTSHRTVLVAEEEIQLDTILVYEVPIPTSFRESGGARGIEVALAFDPRTRARRLDYSATKMEFWLVRCLSADEIADVFMRSGSEEVEQAEAEAEADAEGAGSPTPSQLGRNIVAMTPSGRARSRGANQLARAQFGQRLPDADGDTYHLVVQCRSVWAAPGITHQSFGLAVALWRDDQHAEIYDELRARIEVPVEIEVRR